ncbi:MULTISPECIES: hypothetical protein [unclassified Paracoccus (in: a-proteobacteria)]|uniref:hypothetical protein n=1 Tax=unclassified Paracoccus (in: a-proteobacteria) TaxID=2688777 RepID=UPI0012B19697|nr:MULTISPECIES: hypothetical protein [unclassified Paracoccus (in: a-proteobacteria)]UXU75639.1 hypothetical protein GB879_003860 [Paracoccus sp. SMMA_5]UXU81544.1 hypothetical protein GB880_003850 [Paracoccus sp. SMMA_5_TC]
MLCNDTSLSKIGKIADISYRYLYAKIAYFHDRFRAFTAERQDFSKVDFCEAGSRFATDSQTLIINWPTKRKRTSVAVQHLCTAHARLGFIMEAALQFDPSMSMDDAEARAVAASEDHLSVAFRTHARVWTKTEFEAYLARLQKQKRVKETDLYQLPHQGVLVRYDILQYAHALRIREMVSSANCPIFLVMDDDRGLQQAFAAEIRAAVCDIAVVSFDKGMTNDKHNQVVADGQVRRAEMSGGSLGLIRTLSDEDYAAQRRLLLSLLPEQYPLCVPALYLVRLGRTHLGQALPPQARADHEDRRDLPFLPQLLRAGLPTRKRPRCAWGWHAGASLNGICFSLGWQSVTLPSRSQCRCYGSRSAK